MSDPISPFGISGKGYKATHPVNALLNYTVHAARLERALTPAGLDPYAGTLHVDSDARASAAWDVLELLRAKLDQQVLAWVRKQRWRRHDFDVDDDGMVTLGMNVSRVAR